VSLKKDGKGRSWGKEMGVLDLSRIKHWLDKGWKIAESSEHPLGALTGQRLGEATILVLLGPKNRFGATYFQVYLVYRNERLGEEPVAIGLHNSGPYPSYNWVEIISLAEQATFPSSVTDQGVVADIRQTGLDREPLQSIADLIPPGGHIMIDYDSPQQRETARSLEAGIPPAATALGYLLYSVGCGASFRDWYFAEGGSEGPRKLQGYKPLNEEHAHRRAHQLAKDLLKFLDRPVDRDRAEVEEPARQRAVKILSSIDIDQSELRKAIETALASYLETTTSDGG
jgi:hypothetical protein